MISSSTPEHTRIFLVLCRTKNIRRKSRIKEACLMDVLRSCRRHDQPEHIDRNLVGGSLLGLILRRLINVVFTSTIVSARQMSREAAGLVQGGRPVSRAEKIREILGRQEGTWGGSKAWESLLRQSNMLIMDASEKLLIIDFSKNCFFFLITDCWTC